MEESTGNPPQNYAYFFTSPEFLPAFISQFLLDRSILQKKKTRSKSVGKIWPPDAQFIIQQTKKYVQLCWQLLDRLEIFLVQDTSIEEEVGPVFSLSLSCSLSLYLLISLSLIFDDMDALS